MPPDPAPVSAAEQARTVVLQMMAERGRGVVLVGAACLDLALEHLLLAVMAPSADPDDKLFTPDRSLGNFGAKISLAARLGLIESGIEKAMHAIRSVRNDCAHSAGDPRWRNRVIRNGCSGCTPRPRRIRCGALWSHCCISRRAWVLPSGRSSAGHDPGGFDRGVCGASGADFTAGDGEVSECLRGWWCR